jgi:hypothetical protein
MQLASYYYADGISHRFDLLDLCSFLIFNFILDYVSDSFCYAAELLYNE